MKSRVKPRTKRVRVERTREGVVVSCRLRQWHHLLAAAAGLALTHYLIAGGWLWSDLTAMSERSGAIVLAMLGPWLAYLGICGLVNETRITLDDRRLVVEEGPLPRRRRLGIAIADIEAVFVRARRVPRRRKELIDPIVSVWDLWVVVHDHPVRLSAGHGGVGDPSDMKRAVEAHLDELDRLADRDART